MAELNRQIAPWKDLAPKQKYLLNLARAKTGRKKIIGVFGTRKSGKSVGCENVIADHAWCTKNARILILVPTQGTGSTSGIWSQLTEDVLPRWFEHEICKDSEGNPMRMGWADKGEPRSTVAKKMVCAVTNMHGGISRIEMDSLNDEKDVELNYKSRYYTMIYWSEAGEFKKALSFTTLFMALRGLDYKPDDFVMLVDANPPDEGEDHFLFKFFYELRVKQDLSDYEPEKRAAMQSLRDCLHLTEWTMEDNPYLSQEEKNETKGLYMHDPELYDRYIRAMWKRAVRDALFADVFKPALHVFTSPPETPLAERLILLPSENCTELITSHDAGGANPVSYIIEQLVYIQEWTGKDGVKREREISKFLYLDELAFIGERISVADFTHLKLEMMKFWEKEVGHPVRWWHYSDMSALNFKESITQRTVADEMYAESDGEIQLIGVEKGAGSVGLRIRLWRKLLLEDRVLISDRCPKLIEACRTLRRGKMEGKVADGDKGKHPWDAASYFLVNRCSVELQKLVQAVRARARAENSSDLVTVKW